MTTHKSAPVDHRTPPAKQTKHAHPIQIAVPAPEASVAAPFTVSGTYDGYAGSLSLRAVYAGTDAATATAAVADGKWSAELNPPPGAGYTIVVSDGTDEMRVNVRVG